MALQNPYSTQKRGGYNPQQAASNSVTRLQNNDGNLDEENPQPNAGGIKDLQGTGKLNVTLKQPGSTKMKMGIEKVKSAIKKAPALPKKTPMVSRTVPGKSLGGAGGSFLGPGASGIVKPGKSNVNLFPKLKK